MTPIKEVTLERTYNASPEILWQAWTDPVKLKAWWGPDNVTIPECRVDLRAGGSWYIVMEAGEAMGPYKGMLWPMQAEFTAVIPHALIAYTAHAWTEGMKDDTTIEQTTTIAFTKEGTRTKVKVTAAIYKTGPKATMAVEGMEIGFTQQLAKLEKFLAA